MLFIRKTFLTFKRFKEETKASEQEEFIRKMQQKKDRQVYFGASSIHLNIKVTEKK